MSVKKFSFILKTAKIFHQNLPTHVEEHSLFWLPLCDMPSASRLALSMWHILKARVKYRVRRIYCNFLKSKLNRRPLHSNFRIYARCRLFTSGSKFALVNFDRGHKEKNLGECFTFQNLAPLETSYNTGPNCDG